MSNETILNSFKNNIVGQPNWKIIIRPQKFIEERIKMKDIESLILKNNIRLRGWDYPHWDKNNNIYGSNYVGSFTEFSQIEELWKYYLSGQFENYFSFWEDKYPDQNLLMNRATRSLLIPTFSGKDLKNRKYLEVDSVIYRVAEIFMFSVNLAQAEVLGENIIIEISLNKTEGRTLFIWDTGRELHDLYECNTEGVEISRKLSKTELISKNKEIIIKAVEEIFHKFRWVNVSISLLERVLNNFKNKRV